MTDVNSKPYGAETEESLIGEDTRLGQWIGRLTTSGGRAVTSLVIINIVIRTTWLLIMHPPQYYDFDWYFTHALDMLRGRGYVQYGHYTAYWPMGYPYFLSLLFRLTGPHVTAGLIGNTVLSLGIVILVYLLGRRVFPHRRDLAWTAAFFYSILPSQIAWNSVLGSEELFTFLMLVSLYLYLFHTSGNRKANGWVAISGLVMGVACMVRPIPLLFPVALVLYERFSRGRRWSGTIQTGVVFGLCMFLGLCPVTIRNWIALHHFVLVSTNGGVNLWQGTMTNGGYFWSWNPDVNPLVTAGTDQILENKIGTHVALVNMLWHPFVTIVNGLKKWFYLYWVDWNVIGVTWKVYPRIWWWVVDIASWLTTIAYWLWMIPAVVGIVRWVRRKNRTCTLALPLAFIVYNTAFFFFFPAWDRFRYPEMPLFALWIPLGLAVITEYRKARMNGRFG